MSTKEFHASRKQPLQPDSPADGPSCRGFSLTESLMAIFVVTLGLMAVSQMLVVSIGGPALARAKGSAIMVAQDRLEALGNEYQQNYNGANLTVGSHTAVQVSVANSADGTILNRYNVAWTVSVVTDPRAGVTLQAKQVTVTVTPIRNTGTTTNNRAGLNKVVSVSAIFSPRMN